MQHITNWEVVTGTERRDRPWILCHSEDDRGVPMSPASLLVDAARVPMSPAGLPVDGARVPMKPVPAGMLIGHGPEHS